MSSIAYVADEKMIEYHRLCGNRNINFWRLTGRNQFSDFHRGDLLFFYCKAMRGRKKGFVGYAHYDCTHRLTLHSMWKKYGTLNGYDTEADLQNAIEEAARDHKVPPYMNCLYLKDVVFFVSPVFPSEVNLSVSSKLESYMYLDQEDPGVTQRILRIAEKRGIDPWAASQSFEPESIFKMDEVRHQIALISEEIGRPCYTKSEEKQARQLIEEVCRKTGWETVKGNPTEGLYTTEDEITLAFPYVYNSKDKNQRLLELMGRIAYYKMKIEEYRVRVEKVHFEVPGMKDEKEILELLEKIKHE